MALDPIKTFNQLNEAYKDFLDAQFTFRNDKINKAAKDALSKECQLLKGPFIQATMPYKGTHTLKELVEEGVLNKNIKNAFTYDEYVVYKRYNHQEKAIKLVNNNRSIIVASGTGSGKTECFFIPIINELLNEFDNNTLSPGVRALLIYPMNALANDQIGRLRESLKNLPQITFGRYIGETPEGNRENIPKGRKEANERYKRVNGSDALDNELLTRAEMEARPPHILITNYAMLEYMLLRATSQKIFKGKYSDKFKFLVLDEAHTYKGAHGTEVAMLIRRLKEAVFGRIDNCLTCIGTSATLGGEEGEIEKVVDFAKDLFYEYFDKNSIIQSDRLPLLEVSGQIKDLSYYQQLFAEYQNYNKDDKSAKLYSILSQDKFVYEIRKRILQKTMTIQELSDELKHDLKIIDTNLEDTIAKTIELCGEAISPTDGNPLINAKYHVFARTLEGGFITFADDVKIFTDRKKEYNGYKVYELLNCMKCGQEYIVGSVDIINGEEYLIPTEDDNNDLFMLSLSDGEISIDEDDSLDEFTYSEEDKQEYVMCPKCGKLFPAKVPETISCCGINATNFIKMTRIPAKARKNNCYKCGKFNKGTIRKLTTSEDSATEMLTRKLYQLLPEEKTKKEETKTYSIWGSISNSEDETVNGRKLLVFSDNRQDAAKFAIFIQNRYNDWLWKNIIYNVIKDMNEESISFNLLSERCFRIANEHKLFYDINNDDDKKSIAKQHIMQEVIELDPRMSLNRLGMINIKINSLDKIDSIVIDHFCNDYEISKDEFLNIIYMLFDSLRRQGCVQFPEGVSPTDDAFEPKNRNAYFKSQGGERGKDYQVFGFKPSDKRTNSRLNYLQHFFEHKGLNQVEINEKALNFLDELSNSFNENYFFTKLPILIRDKANGYYQLRLDNISFEKQKGKLYVCDKCGETVKINLFGICTKTNCDGNLVEINENEDRGDYYRQSFSNIQLIPMNAKEHTAQISSQTATDLQKHFKENEVNILSCSTTFEMGVDIGSLESVVLRNVPPETSNYIQRAGRAGRRGSSAAFILTFAKRRSHDLTYYNDPVKMINGIIQAPYIELNNAYLVRRHIHSIIFSYLSYIGYNLKSVKDLLAHDNHPNLNIELYNILSKKPQDLFKSINIIVPEEIKKELGVDNDWAFVKKLVDNNNPNNEDACLDNAINNFEASINELSNAEEKYSEEKKYSEAGKLKRLIGTYNSKDYIAFLAENNVLPRYGFPVYVVPLDLNTSDIVKSSIDLNRDLRMAITEYAPGSQVVANGKFWKPYALKKQPNREWPTYDFAICESCGKIYFYKTALGVESLNREQTCCHRTLKYKQMVIPQFGFITKDSDKESVKLKDEVKYFSETFFNGFEKNAKIEENDIVLKDKVIHSVYSPHGEMFVINRGKYASKNRNIGLAFNVCEKCGYVQLSLTKAGSTSHEHRTANNFPCTGKLVSCYLGHHFTSDALVLHLPQYKNPMAEYESILYAIIEGASKFMEIDRREIGGAVWKKGDTNGFSVTLFDTVPNGAGHVKRMLGHIKEILVEALKKVDGKCGCGEETCCYGCLRNYDNQAYHDTMSRGWAKEYLTWLLS